MKTSTTSSWEPPVLLASDRHDCAAPSESMTMSATEPTPPPQPHEAAEQNLLPFPCTFVRCSFGGSGQVWSGLVRSRVQANHNAQTDLPCSPPLPLATNLLLH